MELEPFYSFPNDLVYTAAPVVNRDLETDDEDDDEHDFIGNPASLPFQSLKELNHVRWGQKSNISRNAFTKFLQLNKADPLYSSRNMIQVAAKIKRIPEHHPSIATGPWISETIGKH